MLGKDSRYWAYVIRTAVGLWMIWQMGPFVSEMRWVVSTEAIAVGIAMFIGWVGLDPFFPKNHVLFTPTPGDEWNPFARYGDGSGVGWFYVLVHLFGSSVVV